MKLNVEQAEAASETSKEEEPVLQLEDYMDDEKLLQQTSEETVEPETEPEVAEEELSFDELFALQTGPIDVVFDEEVEETEEEKAKKKKGKKKRHVQVEYDEEEDTLVYRKKHKRNADEWSEWEL